MGPTGRDSVGTTIYESAFSSMRSGARLKKNVDLASVSDKFQTIYGKYTHHLTEVGQKSNSTATGRWSDTDTSMGALPALKAR